MWGTPRKPEKCERCKEEDSVPVDAQKLAADVPQFAGCLLTSPLRSDEGGGAVAETGAERPRPLLCKS